MRFAASIDPSLRKYLVRLAGDRTLPIAEINRRVGERAESSGRRRPSYAAVRLLVKDRRALPDEPSWLDLYLRVAYAHESPEIFADKITGLANKHRPEDYRLDD